MDGYRIYMIIEFMMFSTYLIFAYLAIQIMLLWKDVDRSRLKLESFFSDSFFKKNSVYIFLLVIFLIIHEFTEGISFSYSYIYFETLELLTTICVVLFTHAWYSALRPFAKKTIPQQLLGNV